jgi:N-acetylglucosaminyl-diphospho-decaprenol L-rhamnosyltransferase
LIEQPKENHARSGKPPNALVMEISLVTILIITWNRKEDILETIASIYKQAYRNFEILVVDNGSTDGTLDAIRQAYPEVRLVALDHNMGTASGRNAGIVAARGEIVFCLDSDASPAPKALTNIVCRFQDDPKLGVINSKIVNAYTKEIDHTAGWVYTERNKADQDREFPSFSFSEGGCAIRRELFDHVGLFWEMLFFGGEGLDYSMRVWDAGYKIIYYPKAVVYHRVSPQRRVAGAQRDCLSLKESLYIYLVRYPWWMLIVFASLKTGATLVRATRQRYVQQVLIALLEVVRQLPRLWSQRRPISNRMARYFLKLQREHGPLAWDLVSWLKYKT